MGVETAFLFCAIRANEMLGTDFVGAKSQTQKNIKSGEGGIRTHGRRIHNGFRHLHLTTPRPTHWARQNSLRNM